MKCVWCGGRTRVTSTNPTKTLGYRRTRKCYECEMTFTTTELSDIELDEKASKNAHLRKSLEAYKMSVKHEASGVNGD